MSYLNQNINKFSEYPFTRLRNLLSKDIKTKEDYALWLELSRKGEKFLCLSRSLVCWRSTPKSLSRPFLTKIVNGFKVYNKFEKKNLLMSLFLVINLGLHYIKKTIDQKKRI